MKPWLYVGAKVVCVDAKKRNPERSYWNPPSEGAIYVVTCVMADRSDPSILCVRLEGQANPSRVDGYDCGYNANRFRPVLPDTTKQVEELKKLMRDHVANASGGRGIRKPMRA